MRFFVGIFLSSFVFFALAEENSDSIEQGSEALAQGSGVDIFAAILSSSPIVQLTLLILVVMSIVSWAIILQKYSFFKSLNASNEIMKDVFLIDGSFEDIYRMARSKEDASLSRIFIGGYNEMQKILQQSSLKDSSLKGIDNIERALRKESENELSYMENHLSFLATVGSSGPFIGLFGTVFGIMNSFNKIAVMGSASLSVVAPGIAEALLATAIGLFAAIPASIFYNSYISQIKKSELLFNNFSTDFLNIAKRNFFQEKNNRTHEKQR